VLSENFEGGQQSPLKGLKRPIKEVGRKGNNYWYKNNLNLKLKIKNNANYTYRINNFFEISMY
jgi:hypothetical protein